MNLKSLLINFLKVGVAVGIIYWLIASGKLDLKVFYLILSPRYLSACLALLVLNVALVSFRWWLLLRSQQVSISYLKSVRYTLVGMFFNYAMPGGVGGDVIKGIYVVRRHPERKMVSGMSILMDRVFGLFTMVLFAFVVSLFSYELLVAKPELQNLFATVVVLGLIFICVGLVIFSSRLMRWVEPWILKFPGGQFLHRLYGTAQFFLKDKKTIAMVVGLSVLTNLTVVLFFMVIAHAMGLHHVSWQTFAFAVPLGLMVMALPISPAGVGVGQAAMLYFFSVMSENSGNLGANAITVYQVVSFFVSLIGAGFFIFDKSKDSAAV